jgi:hypothetical protein
MNCENCNKALVKSTKKHCDIYGIDSNISNLAFQKKNNMRALITFSTEDLNSLSEAIFFTRMETNWQKEWELLLDENGQIITNIEDGIKFIRHHDTLSEWGTGLATMAQAKLGNAQWDNF